MISRAALCFMVLLVTAAGPETYHSAGAGGDSCGKWTSERSDPSSGLKWTEASWILGFLSGVGFSSQGFDPLNQVDAEAVTAWIDNYCHANPLDHLAKAAAAFVYAHPK